MNPESAELWRRLHELAGRVGAIEQGLARLERIVGSDTSESTIEVGQPGSADASQSPAEPTDRATKPTPPTEHETEPGRARLGQIIGRVATPTTPPTEIPSAKLPPPTEVSAEEPATPARPIAKPPARATGRSKLELQIGARWFAWAGAVLVVLATAFFVRVAYDAGWFGLIPPAGRCAIAAVFGALLLGGGEFALRKINRAAAVSLFSAGLGTLYVTAYGTCKYFALVPEDVAFVLMAMVAGLGIGITLRGGILTVGVLSLLGGYGAPVLLASADASPHVLPIYLSLLLGVALMLNIARPEPFAKLRLLAMTLQAILGGLWAAAYREEHFVVAIGFVSFWWLMVQVDAALTASRQRAASANALTSFFGTAWLAGIGCWILNATHDDGTRPLGLFILAIAMVVGVFAFWFGPGISSLRGRPRDAAHRLSFSLWLQTGILLATAIGLYFDDPELGGIGQCISWVALALGCIELGRRLPSPRATFFGLAVLVVAIGRVFVMDRGQDGLNGVIATSPWWRLTPWGLLALYATLATYVASWRLRFQKPSETAALQAAVTVAGASLWLLLVAEQCLDVAIAYGWLIGATAMLLIYRAWRPRAYLEVAIGMLVLVAARGMAFDAIVPRVEPTWDAHANWLVLNPTLILATLTASALWWSARLVMQRETAAVTVDQTTPTRYQLRVVDVIRFGAALLTLLALSFEIDRAVAQSVLAKGPWSDPQVRILWMSLLWAVAGLGMVIGLRGNEYRAMRFLGEVCVIGAAGAWWMVGSLLPRVFEAPVNVPVMMNLQFATGVLIAAMFGALARLTWIRGHGQFTRISNKAQALTIAGGCVGLLAASIEADRAISLHPREVWNSTQLLVLWLCGIWGLGGAAMIIGARWRQLEFIHHTGWGLVLVSSAAWLTAGTILPRTAMEPAPAYVVLNVQFAVGAALAAVMLIGTRLGTRQCTAPRAMAYAMSLAIGLWLGSLELDRLIAHWMPDRGEFVMASRAAISVFWSIYAIALVGAGFRWPTAWMRYAGLGLLVVALLKVVVIDLAQVQAIYRVVSFLGLGLVLILTSIIYAKLATRLEPDAIDTGVRE